jgi:hypothetical protein
MAPGAKNYFFLIFRGLEVEKRGGEGKGWGD